MRKLTADDFKGFANHNGVDLIESEDGDEWRVLRWTGEETEDTFPVTRVVL